MALVYCRRLRQVSTSFSTTYVDRIVCYVPWKSSLSHLVCTYKKFRSLTSQMSTTICNKEWQFLTSQDIAIVGTGSLFSLAASFTAPQQISDDELQFTRAHQDFPDFHSGQEPQIARPWKHVNRGTARCHNDPCHGVAAVELLGKYLTKESVDSRRGSGTDAASNPEKSIRPR